MIRAIRGMEQINIRNGGTATKNMGSVPIYPRIPLKSRKPRKIDFKKVETNLLQNHLIYQDSNQRPS